MFFLKNHGFQGYDSTGFQGLPAAKRAAYTQQLRQRSKGCVQGEAPIYARMEQTACAGGAD